MDEREARQLMEHECKLLAVLDEVGGFTTSDVSKMAFPDPVHSRRQTSGAVRSWLDILKRRGLVDYLDDGHPVCWVRTPAGTKALADA